MKEDYAKLKELICLEIKAKGLTASQVSKLTGVSKPTIYGLMTGKTTPNANTMMKLANGLRIPKSEVKYAVESDGTH